jgi:hypothetical protein
VDEVSQRFASRVLPPDSRVDSIEPPQSLLELGKERLGSVVVYPSDCNVSRTLCAGSSARISPNMRSNSMIRSASLSLSLSIWFSSIRTARRTISQGSPRQPRAVSIRLDTQRRAVTAVLKGRGEQSAGDHAISELADNRGDKARRNVWIAFCPCHVLCRHVLCHLSTSAMRKPIFFVAPHSWRANPRASKRVRGRDRSLSPDELDCQSALFKPMGPGLDRQPRCFSTCPRDASTGTLPL